MVSNKHMLAGPSSARHNITTAFPELIQFEENEINCITTLHHAVCRKAGNVRARK